jgi:8-oxo-dGTP pyrophosphatase MutT (NUDIX family)
MIGADGHPALPHGESLRRLVRERIGAFPRLAAGAGGGRAPDGHRRAAVAVTVLDAGAGGRVLVLKRAGRGTNPGQWALPGGRLEPGEGPIDGALREAAEEVALSGAEVAGVLDDFVTDSGYVITPVVAIAPDGAALRRNPAEVHSLHPIPLARLLGPQVRRWARPADGRPLMQLALRHDMVVHAPTGAILWQFREALLGRHARVADLAQPEWTRR